MPDPLTQQAQARMIARYAQLDTDFAAKMAAVDAAIVHLNTVAATASSAINNSASDRAALHAAVDTLTATVTALSSTASAAATQTSLTALASRVTALEARRLTSHTGTAAVPLIALGGTTTVTITWPTPFPDTVYVCSDPVFSSALVGKATGVVTNQTQTGCTVRVNAGTAAISLGSTVTVVADRYA